MQTNYLVFHALREGVVFSLLFEFPADMNEQ